MQMPQGTQLAVLKTHVGANPIRAIFHLALVALRRAGRRERSLGGKMRLADKSSLITRLGQRAGKTRLTDFGIQINAVVPHAMRQRQHAGEDRRARRLTHQIGRDARREARAFPRETINVRCFEIFIFKTIAVSTLLIRSY